MHGLSPLLLLLAAALVAVMGFAVQRGATCMVAAMDEIVSRGRAHRVQAMLAAGLWAGGILALSRLLGGPAPELPAFVPGWTTVAGGAVLGLGAWINRACVFGAIAKLGSGEWAQAMVPVGFFAGCLAFPGLRLMAGPALPAQPMPDGMALLLALGLAGLILARLVHHRRRGVHPWNSLWQPFGATALIGLLLGLLTLFAGAWTYMDALMALARDPMAMGLEAQALIFLALLAGAIVGGAARGRDFSRRPSLAALARSFAGGFVMALGGLLVPGTNDGLILLGLPLLWPHALVALPAMAGSIAAAMLIARRLPQRSGAAASA